MKEFSRIRAITTDLQKSGVRVLPMRSMLWPVIGCASKRERPPIATVPYVDLEEFMGDRGVIANIPTFVEKDAYKAERSYKLNPDGTIAATFVLGTGGFDEKLRLAFPKSFVRKTKTNAVLGMRIFWPIKADYRIVYLDEGFTQTVIGRKKRDEVWIMAQQPVIAEKDYKKILQLIEDQGYDIARDRKVPQRRPAIAEAGS